MEQTVGILGTGSAAETHINAYNDLKGIHVKSIFSHTTSRAKHFSKKHDIPYHTNRLDDILNDDEISLIDITTLPKSHLSYAELALQKNKGVIIEKPIGIDFKKALSFYHQYRYSPQPILVVYQYPCSQTFHQLKKICRSGRYGRLLQYRVDYRTQRHAEYYQGWTADPKLAGGGVLMNQGIHFVNLLAGFVTSRVTHIRAESTNLKHSIPVEDTITISVQHKNKTRGSYFFSTALPSQMHIELLFEQAFVSTRGDGMILIDAGSQNKIMTPRKGEFKDLISNFLNELSGQPTLKKNFSEAIDDLQWIETAYISAMRGKTIKLNKNDLGTGIK